MVVKQKPIFAGDCNAVESLSILLGKDGEDISYYDADFIDEAINGLIVARSEMKIANFIDETFSAAKEG